MNLDTNVGAMKIVLKNFSFILETSNVLISCTETKLQFNFCIHLQIFRHRHKWHTQEIQPKLCFLNIKLCGLLFNIQLILSRQIKNLGFNPII